jgi:hypothetical protein
VSKHPYWPDLTDDEGDALSEWFDDTCGDCLTGRCHWGGEESRRSEAAVDEGREYHHPTFGACGCSRHGTSVVARRYRTGEAYALAWRDAKQRGEVVVDHD